MNINERQISLRKGGNFSTLDAFFDRRIVKRLPFVDTQDLSISAAQFCLISSTVLSGTIAVGTSSTTSGGYMAAELAGAVGTAATTTIADSYGNILNMVQVRDADTHDEIKEGIGDSARTIYGLIQCSNGLSDGATIGGAGSENLQVSFVYYAADGTLTLATAFTNNIEFQANKLFTQRNVATIEMESGLPAVDILESDISPTKRYFVVTTAFAASEVITLSNGNGSASGRSTATGNTITLNATESDFNADNTCLVKLNGVEQRKGSGNDVVWDSTTTFHFLSALDIGDWFSVERIVK